MEIKYEAVFGDQSLFDSAEPDVFLVETDGVYKTFHKETTGKVSIWTRRGCDLAMRRIIRTPTWTVADKKAGKLPEVGCRVNFCHKLTSKWQTGEIKYIDNQVTIIKTDGIDDRPFVYEIDRVEFKPIESPEEKAARLREEWCIKALSSCSILSGMQKYELKRFGGYIEDIYDALLSGDLPVPVKE